MAGSSADESENDWVLYKDRDEWKDVEPVPQDDGEAPVVSITYSEKFKDVFDYFRAILKSQEKSERALNLTKDALELNSANYTVWQYRREILKALNKNLTDELQYVEEMIYCNPKNYQVWHHRRVIVERFQHGEGELEVTEAVLKLDAKNYHAWQHRQWAIKTFKLFDSELKFVDYLLEDDIRNNSVWNQRYFVILNTTGFTEEVVAKEVEYTINKIKIITDNESAWNYLKGVLLLDKSELGQNAVVMQFCEDLYAEGNRSAFLLALLVDMCEEQCTKPNASGDAKNALDRAKELCKALAEEHDTIRAKYWDHVAENIAHKFEESLKTSSS